jgi:hypothetical protein
VVITTVWKSHNTQNRDLCEIYLVQKWRCSRLVARAVRDKNEKLREA